MAHVPQILKDHPSIIILMIVVPIAYIFKEPEPQKTTVPAPKIDTLVYVCGSSPVFHPTLEHQSFAKCLSHVESVDIRIARERGLRHCKCYK